MVALSVAVHALFLYGVNLKSKALDVLPPVALKVVMVSTPSASPAPILEPQPEIATEKAAVAPKKITKAKPKQVPPVEAIPEPVAQSPLPEAAPILAPSPAPGQIETIAEVPSAAPATTPSIANLQQRSGAKVRAPTPIENPTMPAEDVVVAEQKVIEEPATQPTPMPAIATAPHPLEPVAQDGPPRVESPPAVASPPLPSPVTITSPPRETLRELEPAPIAKIPDKVESDTPSPAPPATASVDPKALPIPASGEAQYKLRMGIVSGELTLSWKFADGHYRLDSVAQGTGLFAVAGKFIQASEGDVATTGLRPVTFSMERRGKKDIAVFNWSDNSVRFTGKSGERTEAAAPGTQDMLSLLFQLAFVPPLGDDLTMIVTNGRKLERYFFERAGNEVLNLEGGKFNTLKISKQRKADEDGVEVWLALEHHYLPVKIRVTDKKGSVVEQSLMSLKVVSAN